MATDVVITTESPTQLRVDMMRGPQLAVVLLLLLMVSLVAVAIYWADNAELDEVTSGIGQVIPSREVQLIQNLEDRSSWPCLLGGSQGLAA